MSHPFYAPTDPEPEPKQYPHVNVLGGGPNVSELPHEGSAIEGMVFVLMAYAVLGGLGYLAWHFWPVIRLLF